MLLGAFLMISGISAFPVFAEEAGAGADTPSPMSPARSPGGTGPVSPSAPAKAADIKVEKTSAGRYYLDFKGASLINVLNVLSNLSGINFVAGPEVAERRVNMTLDNVSLEDVLQAISSGSNVSYDSLPGRNIYLFRASSDSPEKPALFTRVYRLYYVLVSALKEISDSSSTSGSSTGGSSSSGSSGSSSSSGGLSSGGSGGSSSSSSSSSDTSTSSIFTAVEKILSERGKVSADDRSNSLIVTDSEDRLKMVEAAIMQLDRPLDQVLINVLLVETFEDLSRNLGVEWGNSDGYFGTVTGGSQATSFPFLDNNAPGAAGTSPDLLKGLWQGLSKTGDQFNPGNHTGAMIKPGVRDFTQFTVAVKALESSSKLKILAKPKVLVLDNHPAIVKISTNAAIGSTTVTASSGGSSGSTTTTTERAEVGTILRVTPLINTGEKITMTVEPTFATVDQSAIDIKASGAGSTGDPTVRTARTTLMIDDGQTIAMGGLLMSNQSNGNRKVPFFGNLPVVGKALFTSNDKKIQDRELILFVTPYIIRDPAALQTSSVPDSRLNYEDETAPFWKVKQKEWYKALKDGSEKPIDFESYFNVRKKLMDATLSNLDQREKAASQGKL